MNANAIVSGGEYAYTQYPSRNKSYYPFATRVRVMHVYKLDAEYGYRKNTLVECVRLDEETGERETDHYGQEFPVMTVRAREIVSTWEEHLVEKERHEKEETERQERWRKEDEERQQRYAEEQERINKLAEEKRREREAANERLYHIFSTIGVPRSMMTINSYEIRISRHRLEEVLHDSDENVRSATD